MSTVTDIFAGFNDTFRTIYGVYREDQNVKNQNKSLENHKAYLELANARHDETQNVDAYPLTPEQLAALTPKANAEAGFKVDNNMLLIGGGLLAVLLLVR